MVLTFVLCVWCAQALKASGMLRSEEMENLVRTLDTVHT